MLYRVGQNSWEEPAGYGNLRTPPEPLDKPEGIPNTQPQEIERPKPLPPGEEPPSIPVEDFPKAEVPELKGEEPKLDELRKAASPIAGDTAAQGSEGKSIAGAESATKEPLHAEHPTKVDIVDGEGDSTQKKVHWRKQEENFPVPEGKLASLPSGSPKTIPKIQFDFAAEAAEAKTKREGRLSKVKDAIKRSWDGYKKHAWKHDELRPVSAKFRDPFCGWAATLVDSLDTLWIAGLKEEFDEAAKAVKTIDFTFSERRDIPVFETTIRYLGGLLAAYDVSGGDKGEYKILLEKAVELGEILMGIFDTPNRMPRLYYAWEPEYAAEPARAGREGIAELATLSLEFTRLAQLTGSHKYYDAIDRITNALVELQESKTKLAVPGLFPQTLDLSGCEMVPKTDPNTVSEAAKKQLEAAESVESVDDPKGWNEAGDVFTPIGHAAIDEEPRVGAEDHRWDDEQPKPAAKRAAPLAKRSRPLAASGEGVSWDCKPQGVIPVGYGGQSYSMGGSQDSAYEYFPKEYLLLGGLEPKYQKLHEDTIDAINEWLMYRPMIKDTDKWDILFPAKISTKGDKKDTYAIYEMTHLTCFIGGMYGLGAKIFNREKDLETAKKLTDGCVWAYQSTRSGIMPEAAELVPCPDLKQCEFNETTWYEAMDPEHGWRAEAVANWVGQEEERKKAELQALDAKKEGDTVRPEGSETEAHADKADALKQKALEFESSAPGTKEPAKNPPTKRSDPGVAGASKDDTELPASLTEKLDKKAEPAVDGAAAPSASPAVKSETPKIKSVPDHVVPQKQLPPLSLRPQTHEEYIKSKIEVDGYAPGYASVNGRQYILRYAPLPNPSFHRF